MIRTTVLIGEYQCKHCGIIHLLGELFDGQRCCSNPKPIYLGFREVPRYKKTIAEEKAELLALMERKR